MNRLTKGWLDLSNTKLEPGTITKGNLHTHPKYLTASRFQTGQNILSFPLCLNLMRKGSSTA